MSYIYPHIFQSVTAQVEKNLRPLATGPDPLPKKIRLSHAALDKVYFVASNISHDYSQLLSVKERAFTLAFHTGVMVACT